MQRNHQTPQPKQQKHFSSVLPIAILVAAVAVIGIAAGTQLAKRQGVPSTVSSKVSTPVFGDVTVDAVSLRGMTYQQAKNALLEYIQKKDLGRSYVLTYGSKSFPLSGKDLHTSYNLNEILQKAWAARSSASSGTAQYHLTAAAEAVSLKAKLKNLTASLNTAAVEPTIRSFDGTNFTFKEGTPGLKVDEDALLTDTEKAIRDSVSGSVAIKTSPLPCQHTAASLKGKIVKLGSFSTVSTNTESGTYNMARALQSVNGTVIQPGGTFSYLGVVGSADQQHGYRLAGALVNGVSAQEYGGGICQGSTTVYGAALRSNCEIVERSPHSSPSSYAPIGQDATVSYPDLDFKFSNPTAYPMYIQSGADGQTMYCTIYGYNDGTWDKIQVSSQQTGTVPPPADVIKVDKSKPASYRSETVTALTGRYATSSRTFYKNGAAVRTEQLSNSYYPPRAAVYVVGAATVPTASKKPASSAPAASAHASSAPSSAASSKKPA